MKSEPNYFKVNRSLLQSSRWLSEPFTRGQAWIDLFGLAQHTDNFFRVRGIKVDVKRGQLAYSQLTLAKRWRWSTKKTRRYLNELENEGDIAQQKNNLTTLILILKYDFWQGEAEEKEQQTAYQKNTRRTPNDLHTINDKNDKNENKEISTNVDIPLPTKISNRLILSRNQLMAFAKDFPGLSTTEIKEQMVKCNAYMNMSSANYTNPGLFFKGWLNKYLTEKNMNESNRKAINNTLNNLPKISDEERERNLKRLDEMRKTLRIGGIK